MKTEHTYLHVPNGTVQQTGNQFVYEESHPLTIKLYDKFQEKLVDIW